MTDADLPLQPHVPLNSHRWIEVLMRNGWEIVGSREHSYVRLAGQADLGTTPPSVVIPLNRGAEDFGLLMTAAFDTIRKLGDSTWMRLVETLLSLDPVDTFQFRKDTSTPKGLIPWEDGVELIDSARRALIAGAKAYREPSRYYANRFGQFAGRYLDQILMGQSSTGSYIVNALVPVETKIPIRKTAENTLGLKDFDYARGRDVTNSVVRALTAATEALSHYKLSGSMSGFDEQVNSGVSYELVVALRDVARGAVESDITIELAHVDQMPSSAPTVDAYSFEFSGSDVRVLEQASTQLSVPPPSKQLRVKGRVHLLTRKEADGPGVVGIDDGKYRYRVRFGSDEEYHQAVLAHYRDRNIVVEGDLSREGNLRWLYNAQLVSEGSTGPTTLPPDKLPQAQLGFSQDDGT